MNIPYEFNLKSYIFQNQNLALQKRYCNLQQCAILTLEICILILNHQCTLCYFGI